MLCLQLLDIPLIPVGEHDILPIPHRHLVKGSLYEEFVRSRATQYPKHDMEADTALAIFLARDTYLNARTEGRGRPLANTLGLNPYPFGNGLRDVYQQAAMEEDADFSSADRA